LAAYSSIFRWFYSRAELISYAEALRPLQEVIEADISRSEQLSGFCTVCRTAISFAVHSGVMFGDLPNLREGLICVRCGLGNRARLMFTAIVEFMSARPNQEIAILEQLSPLFQRLRETYPGISGSEYVSRESHPGSTCFFGPVAVRHESILSLSYPSKSLDLLSHNDVLEHVFQFRAALCECRRVLRPGGALIFTCPFLIHLSELSVRATEMDDGTITLHAPAEYHGDPTRPEGALTFHHFGWTLLDDCKDAGFTDVACGALYDPFLGFTSNNHPVANYGNMLPIVFRAIA
jgi:SAM-dependent methyltransferase